MSDLNGSLSSSGIDLGDPGIFFGDGVRPMTIAEQRKIWKKKLLCELCGNVTVQECVREGPFRRRRLVPLTTSVVFEGYHIPCYGGHQRLKGVYRSMCKDTTALEQHEANYKKKHIRRIRNESINSSTSSFNPPPIMELSIPGEHEFSSDMSVISSVTTHIEKSLSIPRKPSILEEKTNLLDGIQEGRGISKKRGTSRTSDESHDSSSNQYSNQNSNAYEEFSQSKPQIERFPSTTQGNKNANSDNKSQFIQRGRSLKREESVIHQSYKSMRASRDVLLTGMSQPRRTAPLENTHEERSSSLNELDYPQLISSMRQNAHDVNHIAYGMNIIGSSFRNSNEDVLLPTSWAGTFISILEKNLKNRDLQARSVHTFWIIISSSSVEKNRFVGQGGLPFLAKVIHIHYQYLPISLFGNSILSSLALSQKFSSIVISNQDVISAAFTTLQLLLLSYSKNILDTHYACGCAFQILDLAVQNCGTNSSDTEIFYRLLNDGKISNSFIHATNQHGDDMAFTFHLFRLLFTFSQKDNVIPSESFFNSPRFLDGVAMTMKGSFHEWEILQTMITGLLTNLSKQNLMIPTDILEKIAPHYICLMKTHSSSQVIQKHGCIFIQNICCAEHFVQDLRASLCKLGVIEFFLSRIETYISNETLVAECCKSLCALVIGFKVSKEIIINGNGVEILYNAFKYHNLSKNHEVVHHISKILSSLVENNDAIIHLKEIGFIDKILKDDMEIKTAISHNSILALMVNILCESIQKNILEKSYQKSLLDFCCTELYKRPDDIQTCLDLMRYYFEAGPPDEPDEKEIDFISDIMLKNADVVAVQSKACIVLSRIHKAQLDFLVKHPGSRKEIECLLKALETHGKDKDLQMNACIAINFYIRSLDKNDLAGAVLHEISSVIKVLIGTIKDTWVTSKIIDIANSTLFLIASINKSLEEEVISKGYVEVFTNAFAGLDDLDLEKKIALLEFITYILSRNENNAGSMVPESFVVSIFSSLSHSALSENELYVERCCSVIVLLSLDVFLMQKLVIDNVEYLESLCSLMYRYCDSIPIQSDTFSTITNLALNGTMRAYFSTQGCLGLAIECIRKHGINERLRERACGAVCSLVTGTQPDILKGLDIITFTLLLMIENMGNEKIVEKCIEILHRVSSISDDFKSQMIANGIINIIIEAMRHHLGYSPLQDKACLILWSFTTMTSVISQIGEKESISVILNGISAQIKSSSVQKEGLGLLKSLSTDSLTRNLLLNDGGIQVILGAMWVHCDKEVIQHFALVALSNIVVDGNTGAVLEVSNKELEAVANSMLAFPDSKNVQECACRLLRNYTFEPKNTLKIAENDHLLQLLSIAENKFESSCKARVIDIRERIQEAFIASS